MNQRNPKAKLLLGPGPSNVDPRILRALSEPTLGHLDPEYVSIMDETADLLRYVFQTKNPVTLPVAGTGSAGMEAAVVNAVEPGDKMIVCTAGFFGDRMIDVAERAGANVVKVESPWGSPTDPEDVEKAVRKNPDAKVIGIVHAETSTGVVQPLGEIAEIAHANGMRILVDTVASLGGVDVPVDKLGLDIVYSGSQKCLGCPPGLAPITLNEKSAAFVRERKTKCQSWYFDLEMIARYWGSDRFYHHTGPINMTYALNEALRMIKEEGLEARFARHKEAHKALVDGLGEMGLKLVVNEPYRLPSLTTVYVPEGVDEAAVRKQLMQEFLIDISGGLGVFKGKIWRIGLMGVNATRANVIRLLGALKDILG